jgi:hypothetical protein
MKMPKKLMICKKNNLEQWTDKSSLGDGQMNHLWAMNNLLSTVLV